VSFTRKADSTPETRMTAVRSTIGYWARVTIQPLTRRKKPDSRKLATTIITPSSKMIVLKSMTLGTSSSGRIPTATMRLAPTNAAPARSSQKPGSRPIATTR
jgi:hypothetical protein